MAGKCKRNTGYVVKNQGLFTTVCRMAGREDYGD
jgi:hypothetical protein